MSRSHNTITTLVEMLGYRRPAGSKTERKFIRRFIEPLGVQRDALGNLIKRIGNAPVLWSCHTDSVHREGGMQNIDLKDGFCIGLSPQSCSNCLGADDAVGVYLMREMILAERPGLYVFHRSEECGGYGSNFIAQDTPALLKGIRFAIALDRRGKSDVITHQAGGRCCSDAFAESLTKALGGAYAPCDTGMFTDTANYTDLIGECTNVSVGYSGEHTAKEALDLRHVLALREALLDLDHTALEFSRKPGEHDPFDDQWGWPYGEDQTPLHHETADILKLIKDHPTQIADILLDYGMGYVDLADEIWERGGNRGL